MQPICDHQQRPAKPRQERGTWQELPRGFQQDVDV